MEKMQMADRIKERRKAMGYTQTELGEKLGLQASAIAKYENGRVENIKRTTIVDMAKVLECSPAYLMGWFDSVENESDTPKAFANEAEFGEAYERFLANLPQAGLMIKDSHARMEASFQSYLDAFEKWVFRHAYEAGYAAAMATGNVSTYAAGETAESGDTVKEYRVKYWHGDEDGREDYMEFEREDQAMEFYNSLDGKAEVQRYIGERHEYEAVVYPEFEV